MQNARRHLYLSVTLRGSNFIRTKLIEFEHNTAILYPPRTIKKIIVLDYNVNIKL